VTCPPHGFGLGVEPNTTTQGGFSAHSPPITQNQWAGSPSGGWQWDEGSATGRVSFRAAKNKLVSPYNDVADAADLAVSLQLKGIVDTQGLASGPGSLQILARMTMNDRIDGDMTTIDFPFGFGFTLSAGKVKLKTSVNAVLTDTYAQPELPHCTAIEMVDVRVIDENGTEFARLGTFLPQ